MKRRRFVQGTIATAAGVMGLSRIPAPCTTIVYTLTGEIVPPGLNPMAIMSRVLTYNEEVLRLAKVRLTVSGGKLRWSSLPDEVIPIS